MRPAQLKAKYLELTGEKYDGVNEMPALVSAVKEELNKLESRWYADKSTNTVKRCTINKRDETPDGINLTVKLIDDKGDNKRDTVPSRVFDTKAKAEAYLGIPSSSPPEAPTSRPSSPPVQRNGPGVSQHDSGTIQELE